ncbi:folate-binding protein [Deinococcus sp. KNUC1210]|uniref:CAF17-like 4Fe-4S cluster assembly/insertion protein YgfZ n=1 Tax=Deinococcus sp. KNUC1210 TaxID=2917691 RepID=UPI001EF13C60|nr:folate-binding protein [Deinococcus sp. KNUC1210]ULH14701.1 folate-binding protein [Deinococcus sp. KNUC1210]
MSRFTRLPSSALRLTGPDRLDFVQGQMTGNLKAAPTPGMVPACFLNVKGQIEQFARVYRRPDDVYLHLDEGAAQALAARLKKYIIFDQVEVQDVSAVLATLHLWNEDLPGWNGVGADVQQFQLGGGVVLAARVNRTGTPGLDVHYLQQHGAELLALLGQDVPFAELEAARIQAGISDVGRDGWAGSLLQEVGLDDAISYRKGCYVGQEIMARLEARGKTRYSLARLEAVSGPLPAHTEILLDGRAVGVTGASAGTLALAKLRRDAPSGALLTVGTGQARAVTDADADVPQEDGPAHVSG